MVSACSGSYLRAVLYSSTALWSQEGGGAGEGKASLLSDSTGRHFSFLFIGFLAQRQRLLR